MGWSKAPYVVACLLAVVVAVIACGRQPGVVSPAGAPGHGVTLLSSDKALPQCQTSQLSAEFGTARAFVPGRDEIPLVFTNTSAESCAMAGFPGFTLTGPESDGSTTYSPPRSTVTPAPVTLEPHHHAYAVFTWVVTPGACDEVGGWVPTAVMSIPPDQTTALTVPWNSGVVDNCPDTATPPGTYIGPVQPGADGPPPLTHQRAAARWAAQALYAPDGEFWSSSGVISSGSQLLLAVGTVSSGPQEDKLSVGVYQWERSRWIEEAKIGAEPFFGLGVGGGSIVTRSLTGSPRPDFEIMGDGADSEFVTIVSDVGGRWHAVPFDNGSGLSPVGFVGEVSGRVIWGTVDLCSCAADQPKLEEWFAYSKGAFRPTTPIGPQPPCVTSDFDAAAAGGQPGATFARVACRDGWALASGTDDGASVIGVFNWQGDQWASEGVSSLANYPSAFVGPTDLLKQLGSEIGVALPAA